MMQTILWKMYVIRK